MAKIIRTFYFAKRMYSGVPSKVKAQKYVLTKYFQGEPKKTDFKIVEEKIPELKDGEVLAEAEYLSVDPYMRAYMIGYKLPADMIGEQVAKIIASRNDKYSVGSYVTGSFGWRTHTIFNPDVLSNQPGLLPVTLLPDINPHPVSLGLGVLGMPGNTAYFGSKEILQLNPKDTLVITGAAGAVGSHVGQIGKILGCRVVGFAGSDEKCQYLEKELGFDHAFNYKTVDIKTALREGCPDKIDCYFDNVGGEISSQIMSQMNKYGRVAVCGSISSYNDSKPPKVSLVQPAIVFKELKVEGFLVYRWVDRWNEGINVNLNWLREGKLKYQEKVYHGFENMVDALVVNVDTFVTPIGKAIAVADDDYLYILSFEDSKNLEKKFETLSTQLECKFVESNNKLIEKIKEEFSQYLKGSLKKFTVPVKFFGTDFQNAVWNKLLELPYGSTQTYADLAVALGRAKSHSRAVGGACGANPLLVVVPCHRLVGVASKGGYNSGEDRKDKLLKLENTSSS
ncbi:unnamed protein product [Arctia plantaginis]|uniref:Methylated-DNA--protein-cysteine methyltransferase n=1 Tax=Arctia plantaginis TaxID=874455 RepID=A0A8S1BP66_ARCPL|nr:unnamed protein product [Arctia plantaginis]